MRILEDEDELLHSFLASELAAGEVDAVFCFLNGASDGVVVVSLVGDGDSDLFLLTGGSVLDLL